MTSAAQMIHNAHKHFFINTPAFRCLFPALTVYAGTHLRARDYVHMCEINPSSCPSRIPDKCISVIPAGSAPLYLQFAPRMGRTPFNSGFCVGNHAKTPRVQVGLYSNVSFRIKEAGRQVSCYPRKWICSGALFRIGRQPGKDRRARIRTVFLHSISAHSCRI